MSLPDAILETILDRLALLFLAGTNGDLPAAREAARQMLAAYQPETPQELSLAAEIISFGFHAMEALSQAAAPDMPLAKILRLRGSAVSLSREGHKSQRKLDQLQKHRRAGTRPAETEAAQTPEPARPRIDQAIALIAATREAMTAANTGGKIWTQSCQQHLNATRIAENLRKNQAAHAALNAARPGSSTIALSGTFTARESCDQTEI